MRMQPLMRKYLRKIHYSYFFMNAYYLLGSLFCFIRMRQRGYVARTPRTIQIELDNRCNLFCKQCARQTRGLPENMGYLGYENFLKIMSQFQHLDSICLNGFGEVLLNKDLFRIVEWCKSEMSNKISFFTNGTLIDQDIARKIVSSGLDTIIVSIDAATPKTHEKIRKSKKDTDVFRKIVDGIKLINDEKLKQGSKSPELNVSFALMPDNLLDVEKIIELTGITGIATIGFGEINGIWSDNTITRKTFIKTVINAHKKAKKVGIHLGCSLSLKHSCIAPWESPYITWDGSLVPCCWNPYPEKINFGNIFESPFEEIWNNEAMRNFRRALSSGKIPHSCKNCCWV
jgi:radical SAM protein with 4Fe4S-binding SPASM domain